MGWVGSVRGGVGWDGVGVRWGWGKGKGNGKGKVG